MRQILATLLIASFGAISATASAETAPVPNNTPRNAPVGDCGTGCGRCSSAATAGATGSTMPRWHDGADGQQRPDQHDGLQRARAAYGFAGGRYEGEMP